MGPIESMYGGSGLKAAFNPATHIVLPSMRIPWKIEGRRYSGQASASAKLAVSLPEEREDVVSFVRGIEAAAIDYIGRNRKKMFPGKKSSAPIEDLFNTAIRGSDDFDPVFQAKLMVKTDAQGADIITTPCFDMQTKELVDGNALLNKGAMVTAVVQPVHIYAINNTVGVTWKVIRLGFDAYESDTPAGAAMDDFDFGN